MRVGAFELKEPLPDLPELHALAMLRPWIDVGSVGSMSFTLLENHLHAHHLGELAKPGTFFDFTRYRPVIRLVEGQRRITVPNTFINYAKLPEGNGFLLFHLLEPHMLGEVYAGSVLRVLQKFGVKRYCLIGGMYDAVPHTKPLIVSGIASGIAEEELHKLDVWPSGYEGPTTIAILISEEAPKYNIEVMTLIVHLPQYARFEEDYAGELRLLEILCSLYHLPINLEQVKTEAERQYRQLDSAMEREPDIKKIIQQLEAHYEARVKRKEKTLSVLSPEIEKFLRDLSNHFTRN